MAAGLESERVKLERDCESYQVDCQREESRYHMLNCMTQIADANMERVRLEDQFSRGSTGCSTVDEVTIGKELSLLIPKTLKSMGLLFPKSVDVLKDMLNRMLYSYDQATNTNEPPSNWCTTSISRL